VRFGYILVTTIPTFSNAIAGLPKNSFLKTKKLGRMFYMFSQENKGEGKCSL
jgi:hypothetical protein